MAEFESISSDIIGGFTRAMEGMREPIRQATEAFQKFAAMAGPIFDEENRRVKRWRSIMRVKMRSRNWRAARS